MAGPFTKTAVQVFAGTDAAGKARQVNNHDAQVWGSEVERAFALFQAGGGVVFTSKAEAEANLDYAANTMAWVTGDDDEAGLYQKQGASGGGSWVRVGDLPYSFIRAENVGAGTANAIQATTVDPIPQADGGALIALPISEANSASPVTVSFNGGPALTIKDVSGDDIPVEGFAGVKLVAGYKIGAEFRLFTDYNSAVHQAAAKAWAANPEDDPVGPEFGGNGSSTFSALHYAKKAGESASVATGLASAFIIAENTFANRAAVEAWSPEAAPDYIRTAGYASAGDGGEALYKINGTGDGDLVITLDDGVTTVGYDVVPLYAEGGRYPASAFGATGDGMTDDRDAIAAADAAGNFILGAGQHRIASDLTINSDIWMADGATLVPDAGVTVTINGLLRKPSGSAAFAGAGTVNVSTYDVHVPADFPTIREAIAHKPKILYQSYRVRLAEGTYDEDVYVEDVHTVGMAKDGQGGPAFILAGASETPKDPNVRIRSFAAASSFGSTGTVTVRNMTVTDTAPYEVDDPGAVFFWGVRRGNAVGLSFAGNGAKYCIVAYASDVTAHSNDFGDGVNESATLTKHGGTIIMDTGPDAQRNVGHLTEYGYQLGSSGGPIVGAFLYDITSNKALFRDNRIGVGNAAYAFDTEEGIIHGLANLGDPGVTRIYTMFESLEGYNISVSGSGAVTMSVDGPTLTAGADGGVARMSLSRRTALFGSGWAKSRDFAIAMRPSSDTDILVEAVTGDRDDKCFGFRYENGTLYGIARNGGAAFGTVNLGSFATGELQVFARFYKTNARSAPNNRIEFYDRFGNKLGELATELPTGGVSTSWNVLDFRLESASAHRAAVLGECYMSQRGFG